MEVPGQYELYIIVKALGWVINRSVENGIALDMKDKKFLNIF